MQTGKGLHSFRLVSMSPSTLRLGPIRRYDRMVHSHLSSVVSLCSDPARPARGLGPQGRPSAHTTDAAHICYQVSEQTSCTKVPSQQSPTAPIPYYTSQQMAPFPQQIHSRCARCSPAASAERVDTDSLQPVLAPSELGPPPAVIFSEASSPPSTRNTMRTVPAKTGEIAQLFLDPVACCDLPT